MTNNSMDWRYYEDIEVGEERKSKSIKVTEKEIIDFAKKYDPQWFHSDPEESKQSSFKGLIASGIHVAAIWRLLDHDANGDIKFVLELRKALLEFDLHYSSLPLILLLNIDYYAI